jgi:hypothetical protein
MRHSHFILALSIATPILVPAVSAAQVASPAPSASPTAFIPFQGLTTGAFATSTPWPNPSAPPTPLPLQPKVTPAPAVLFVLATGGDAPTRQKFVATLAQKLQIKQRSYSSAQLWNVLAQRQVRLVAEPDWGISDYTGACQSSHDISVAARSKTQSNAKIPSNTETQSSTETSDIVSGALIVGIDSVSGWVSSQYVWKTNFTKLIATLIYSACNTGGSPSSSSSSSSSGKGVATAEHLTTSHKSSSGMKKTVTDYSFAPPKDTSAPPYSIAWNSGLWEGTGHQGFLTPLPLLSLFMTGVSAWAAFTPSVTKSTINTTVFPTPAPGVPVPPSGYVSSSVTNNSKTSNAAQLVAVTNGFLSNQANLDTSQPLSATSDQTTNSAVDWIVNVFLFDEMRCPGRTQSVAQNPGTICFAVLTKRNDGTDPDIDPYYKVIGFPDQVKDYPGPMQPRVFNDCTYTYLQMPDGVGAAQLSFMNSSGVPQNYSLTSFGQFYVVYGLPARIKLVSSSPDGAINATVVRVPPASRIHCPA